ncbi:MAG: hypothetical protein RL398_2419 [Planctomycetota bacterium]|jgi:cyanophycinase
MRRLLAALSLPLLAMTIAAQSPIDPRGVVGTRFLVGGGKTDAAVYERFLALCGGKDARIVLIPTASATADEAAGRERTLQRWRDDHPGIAFELLHTRDRAQADDEAFTAPLRTATGVWLGGGAQERLAEAYLGTRVERELYALLARGGVVGGTSAGTAIQSRTMIREGMDPPVMAQGFDLLPHGITDQHFYARQRLPRLRRALALRPGHFGIGIDEGTAVELSGRTLQVHGRGKVALVLPAGAERAESLVELVAGDRADLPTWQRAAQERVAAAFPPPQAAIPEVPNGTAILVGGGRLPPEVIERFVAAAGGERAKVVIVPSAMPKADRRPDPMFGLLRRAGVRDLHELDCAHPDEATAERLAVLDEATAVWFGGGRQWRLCDAFDGTAAIAKFRGVLSRGGVIGGSSAGATIQGEYLVRGNPLGNIEMWCEGYTRGFALLPGTAVDQHFVARDRLGDMVTLKQRFPQITGLGIDEGTAAIVRGRSLEVVGTGSLAVFPAGTTEPMWLKPGDRYAFTSPAASERK